MKQQKGESIKKQREAEQELQEALPFLVLLLTLKSVTFYVQRANKYRKVIWSWKLREVWRRKDLVGEGFVKGTAGCNCLTELCFITDASQP